ncbi:hypothetical protein FACS1894189_7730 [Planctomycetales bacterium]|nr:hypothetical protein FACS1894189_7730 [Planctomycetales bacterium]
MYQFNDSFIELLKRDRRYQEAAYAFVYEVLEYAQNVLHLGANEVSEPLPREICDEEPGETDSGRHISGVDLCYAAREYAVLQYGLLAGTVLAAMGIRKTDDIGEIVYNLIGIGQMRKTPQDRKEDFNNVFDLEQAFLKASP